MPPGHDADPAHPLLTVLPQLAGVVAALYLVLAWCLGWPGGWTVQRWVEPARERRAREVALHASERFAAWRAENERAPAGTVVFLGSSTIERMPLGELFPGKPALNRGVARANALELARWLDRMLPRATPAAFVVYAGSVDRREDGAEDAAVAVRVLELLRALRARAPGAAVVLLGVLPAREPEPELAELDRLLRNVAADLDPRIAFVPTRRPPLSSADGLLAEGLSSDSLHLDDAGYRVLARWIVEGGGPAGRLLAP